MEARNIHIFRWLAPFTTDNALGLRALKRIVGMIRVIGLATMMMFVEEEWLFERVDLSEDLSLGTKCKAEQGARISINCWNCSEP